jgi:NAD+ synthase
MALTLESLAINPEQVSKEIEDMLRTEVDRRKLNGVLIGLSGGLDSTVAAKLSVRAIGAYRVKGLFIHERECNPKAIGYARRAANDSRISLEEQDMTEELKKLGVYNYILSYIPGVLRLKEGGIRLFHLIHNLQSKELPFLEYLKGTDNWIIKKGIERMFQKCAVRERRLANYAREHNLLYVDGGNKSESLLGIDTKDVVWDIAPLSGLYRTQIIQLGRHLELPEVIVNRPADTDMIPGTNDKYLGGFGLTSDKIDLVLYGFENQMSSRDIAGQLGLKEAKVDELREIVGLVEKRRHSERSYKLMP